MKGYLNTFLAIVTLVYMTLPNCPCQLLEPLGMDFPHKHLHGEIGGNPDYNGQRDLGKKSSGSDQELPLCVCEDGMMKTAEESEFESLSTHEERSNVAETTVIFEGGHEPCFRHGFTVPPPEIAYFSVYNRALTGVYRL